MYFIELGVNENSMKVWVVGIDHELQLIPDPTDTDKRRAQKDQLKSILASGILLRGVRFIAEKSKLGKTTIAMNLAASNNPIITWINIIMTDAEREAAGIANVHRPGHPDYDTMEFWIESRIPEDLIGEDFFITTTLQQAGDLKAFSCCSGIFMSMRSPKSSQE